MSWDLLLMRDPSFLILGVLVTMSQSPTVPDVQTWFTGCMMLHFEQIPLFKSMVCVGKSHKQFTIKFPQTPQISVWDCEPKVHDSGSSNSKLHVHFVPGSSQSGQQIIMAWLFLLADIVRLIKIYLSTHLYSTTIAQSFRQYKINHACQAPPWYMVC